MKSPPPPPPRDFLEQFAKSRSQWARNSSFFFACRRGPPIPVSCFFPSLQQSSHLGRAFHLSGTNQLPLGLFLARPSMLANLGIEPRDPAPPFPERARSGQPCEVCPHHAQTCRRSRNDHRWRSCGGSRCQHAITDIIDVEKSGSRRRQCGYQWCLSRDPSTRRGRKSSTRSCGNARLLFAGGAGTSCYTWWPYQKALCGKAGRGCYCGGWGCDETKEPRRIGRRGFDRRALRSPGRFCGRVGPNRQGDGF